MRRWIPWIAGVLGLIAVIVTAVVLVAFAVSHVSIARIVATPLATFYIEHRWLRYTEGAFVVYYPAGGAIANDPVAWLAPRLEAFQHNCQYLGVNCDEGY
jgi:hypothetical protein